MKEISSLILLIFLTTTIAIQFKTGSRVKFGMGPNRGKDYYIPIPTTIEEAKDLCWEKTTRPKGHLPCLELYCPPEYNICVLFDDTGYIAGSQIAVEKNRFKNASLVWKTQGYTEWTVNGLTYWTMAQYFVDEEFLEKCADSRITSRDSSKILQTDAIWLTSFYGKLLRIPVNVNDTEHTNFSQQACVIGMGHHYYYNITNTVCDSNLILPWFILYYEGRLVATLWATFGELPPIEGQRDWFERPDQGIIKKSFPSVPECHLQLSTHTVSLHQWFIGNPWDLVCN